MPTWTEGDRVKVVARPVTEDDRKKNRYFSHMAGLIGTVQSAYNEEEIAVKIDPTALVGVTRDVHKTATDRMRARFLEDTSEVQKKALSKEELEFEVHYVLVVQSSDLESI